MGPGTIKNCAAVESGAARRDNLLRFIPGDITSIRDADNGQRNKQKRKKEFHIFYSIPRYFFSRTT